MMRIALTLLLLSGLLRAADPDLLWLKADSLGTGDGTPIDTWVDSSVAGNNATGTGATRPTKQTVSGNAVVRFDGTDDRLLLASAVATATSGTILVVMAPTATITSSTNQAILGRASGVAPFSGIFLGDIGPGWTNEVVALYHAPTVGQMKGQALMSNVSTGMRVHQFTMQGDAGDEVKMRHDGVSKPFAVASGGGLTPTYSFINMDEIGSLAGAWFFSGDIAEIAIFSGAVSLSDVRAFAASLGTKYGITMASLNLTNVSPEQSAVWTAKDAAVPGETITIAAGTATWTNGAWSFDGITFLGISVIGAGVGQTIIRSGMTADSPLIAMGGMNNRLTRLSGIEFNMNGGTFNSRGHVHMSGSEVGNRDLRLDHCKFDQVGGFQITVDDVVGVIDHNEFLSSGNIQSIYVWNRNWGGVPMSDGSWADPPNLGDGQKVFIEDNVFTRDTGYYLVIDSFRGGRFVVRYNTFTRCGVGNHGTESSGRDRGARVMEVYENVFNGVAGSNAIDYRSATGVAFNNTFDAATGIKLNTYRLIAQFAGFPGATGFSVWDVNYPNGPFATGGEIPTTGGTFTATGGGTWTVTVAGIGWTVNEWVGYSIQNMGALDPAGELLHGIIISNTSDTLTISDIGANVPWGTYPMTFTTGDEFRIWRVKYAMDMAGRGQGGLVSGDPAVPPSGWNDQVNEPIYEWNNTVAGGGNVGFSNGYGFIEGEHFVIDTVKPGYTPYTYPHPLATGGGPQPPTGGSRKARRGAGAIRINGPN